MRWTLLLAAIACNGGTTIDETDTDDTDVSGPIDRDEDGSPSDEDCDDNDFEVYPGADEYCDGKDNDCDGDIDEDAVNADTYYVDGDKDGYGANGSGTRSCHEPPGTATRSGDCDDEDPAINAGAIEICDPDDVDEDCNGTADDDDPGTDPSSQTLFHSDRDGDGYGDPDTRIPACDEGEGRVADGTDCDDDDPLANPELGCGFDWDGPWTAEGSFEFDIPEARIIDKCSFKLQFTVNKSVRDQVRTTSAGVCDLRTLGDRFEVFYAGSFDKDDTIIGTYTIGGDTLSADGAFSNPPPTYTATGKGSMILGKYKATASHSLRASPAK